MKIDDIQFLYNRIDAMVLVSFDVFDTLLFRKTNTPESIFEIIGTHFGIQGFKKIRIDDQNEASRRVYAKYGYPHANIDEIYEVMSERKDISVDWDEIKQFEIQLEKDALVANSEMLDIFCYAKKQGKRVVATSDMYLFADTLREILEEKGFIGFDYIYCSADEHKAKFNRDLFEFVAKKEGIEYKDIIHIGDKERDDGDFPASYGINTFVYKRNVELDKLKNTACSIIDNGIYKILVNDRDNFWYNLGVEVGGPLYMGIYKWLKEKLCDNKGKIYFLSRDGYNLFCILKKLGIENIEYLYTSRRALTLASITELNEQEIKTLPPYTYGQTVGEILDYLCVNPDEVKHIKDVGFCGYDDVIKNENDIAAFRELYKLDGDVFLERCEVERRNALVYFNSLGFFEEDAICFDCGWQGSSQDLLERFKRAVGIKKKNIFYYFGIKRGEKSFSQLHQLPYDAFLFDCYKNHELQTDINDNVVMYELFFSAPHESLFYYGDNGKLIFEDGNGNAFKKDMLQGIVDFFETALSFVEKYHIEYTLENSVAHLRRLIDEPTDFEAITIGNVDNVDGFARKQGEKKYIARVCLEQLNKNENQEVYWVKGLLSRTDIPEEVKVKFAQIKGINYSSRETHNQNLESKELIENYENWLKKQAISRHVKLVYNPKFSIVIPVYNTEDYQLIACIESVLSQTYDNFELILVDDNSSWENVRHTLKKYEPNSRVTVVYRENNGHISEATNSGIEIATGDYIVFMDCDDTIDKDALYYFACKLNDNPNLDFIYSDEDKLTEDGSIMHMPFFKPDWSPDLFMCMMYTNHLAVYRTELVREVGGLRTAYNGAQDYDFTLRFMELSSNDRVGHIPKVLYHWRERKESVAYAMGSKRYAIEAACAAKEDYIRRNNIKAHMETVVGLSQHRVVYDVVGNPLVSIIITSFGDDNKLTRCIESIKKVTLYKNYEILIAEKSDNDTMSNIVKDCLEKSKGEYFLFLSDRIEVFQAEWLNIMLGHAQQRHTGAVGAKLLYPLSTDIYCDGIIILNGEKKACYATQTDVNAHDFCRNRVEYNYLAVSNECLLVSRDKLCQVNSINKEVEWKINDVDLCTRLYEKGYYNVVRNDVYLYSESVQCNEVIKCDLGITDPFYNVNFCDEGMLFSLPSNIEYSTGYKRIKHNKFKKYPGSIQFRIDDIRFQNEICISGWCMCNVLAEKYIKSFVILESSAGECIKIPIKRLIREDVKNRFGCRTSKLGFKVRLDSNCIDRRFAYKIGIFSKYPFGIRKKYQDTGVDIPSVTGKKYVQPAAWSKLDVMYMKLHGCKLEAYDRWIDQNEKNVKLKAVKEQKFNEIQLICIDSGDVRDKILSSTSEYIVLATKDYKINSKTLSYFEESLCSGSKIVYADEDFVNQEGKRTTPFFKPDWSPDTFEEWNYLGGVIGFESDILKNALGKFQGNIEGNSDDKIRHIVQQCIPLCENCDIKHISRICSHKTKKEEFCAVPKTEDNEVDIEVNNELVSIVIPSKDNYEILMRCIESIRNVTTYKNYQIVLVDNGSKQSCKEKLEKVAEMYSIKYIYQPEQFNFSHMCNLGVENSDGEYILLLNDDIEVLQSDWLDKMLTKAKKDHVGAVGAKLLYPGSSLIQHIGITNLKIGPSHNLMKMSDDESYYFGRNKINYNVIAVTGACLMVNKEKYYEIGMMDEKLPVAYNDVDLCFSLHEAGYYNVVRNDVCLYHHESVSRGADDISEEKKLRLQKEKEYLYEKHPALDGVDPYYNINLSTYRGDFGVADVETGKKKVKEVNAEKFLQVSKLSGYSIDSIVISDNINISGWALTHQLYEVIVKRELVLVGDERAYVISLNRCDRLDVHDIMHCRSRLLGFNVAVDKTDIKPGVYKIGIATRYPFGLKKKFVDTNRKIVIN